MTQLEKIIEYHVNRLKNNSNKPDIQLDILRELMLLGNQAELALPALRELHESTESETVRKVSQRVAKHIFVEAKKAKEAQGE